MMTEADAGKLKKEVR